MRQIVVDRPSGILDAGNVSSNSWKLHAARSRL